MEGKLPAGQISIKTFLCVAEELRELERAMPPETTIEFYTVDGVLWYELQSNAENAKARVMFEAP